MSGNQPADCGEEFTLHLLDAAKGVPVQTWTFYDLRELIIGRGDGAGLKVVDPQVSRVHAVLQYRDGAWWLESKGRHGTLVGGEKVASAPLIDKTVFRLGSDGPTFQFAILQSVDEEKPTIEQTLDGGGAEALSFLEVDEAEISKEVEEIAMGEAFRELQARARRIREGRAGKES